MHVSTISGADLGGITDVLSKIGNALTSAGGTVVDAAQAAIAAGCNVVGSMPAAHPYITAAQAGCQVGTGVGVIPGSGGQPTPIATGPTASSPGGKLMAASTQSIVNPQVMAQLQAQQQQQMLTKALTSTADKPIYKKPLFWVAIAGGVAVVGGGAVLLTRGGRKRR